jgi:hypothetical protein
VSIHWTPTLIAVVDDDYDVARASDGRSRFGVYLRQHTVTLHDCDELLDAGEFAALVWHIAGTPVMSPGYVRLRPDIHTITPTWSEDGGGRLMFDVAVRLPHALLRTNRTAVPARWRDWQTQPGWDGDGGYPWWAEPEDTSRPALLTTTVIRLPVDDAWSLPRPRHTDGPGLVADAKRSVVAVAATVNRVAGPVVASLRGEAR